MFCKEKILRRALEGPPDGTAAPLLRIKPGHQFPYLARILPLGTLRDRELPRPQAVAGDQAAMVPGGRHPRAERDAIRRAAWPDAPDTEMREAEREALGEAKQQAAARLRGAAFAIAPGRRSTSWA